MTALPLAFETECKSCLSAANTRKLGSAMAQHTTARIKNDQKRRAPQSGLQRGTPLPIAVAPAPRLPPRARTRDRVGGNRPTCHTLLATWRRHTERKRHSERTAPPSGEMNDPVVGLVNSQTGHLDVAPHAWVTNQASVSRTDNPTTRENTARPEPALCAPSTEETRPIRAVQAQRSEAAHCSAFAHQVL